MHSKDAGEDILLQMPDCLAMRHASRKVVDVGYTLSMLWTQFGSRRALLNNIAAIESNVVPKPSRSYNFWPWCEFIDDRNQGSDKLQIRHNSLFPEETSKLPVVSQKCTTRQRKHGIGFRFLLASLL